MLLALQMKDMHAVGIVFLLKGRSMPVPTHRTTVGLWFVPRQCKAFGRLLVISGMGDARVLQARSKGDDQNQGCTSLEVKLGLQPTPRFRGVFRQTCCFN